MKHLAALLVVGLVSCGPAPAQEAEKSPGDVVITIPAARVEQCAAEGGCRLFTRLEFEMAMEAAKERGEAEGAERVIADIDKVIRARASHICRNEI